MKNEKLKRYDKSLAIVFGVSSILFILLMAVNTGFFDWAFTRHQNQLSWYIRPLFLIPFCFFSYRRSWAGIFGTIFLLLTSMFWFPAPVAVDDQVRAFLQMEKDYLTGDWGLTKILISLLIPVSLTVLSMALWKRSLWLGISVLVFMAVAKMLWSVAFGGTSGKSIILPAIIGLIICIALVYVGFKKLEKRKKSTFI
ncbi:membrane protein [Paenibacillus sp. DMB20]|uniref:membrane protein n=1 Tax=Paenibacillus sp. DMB20 TaxID=1642570 RepID=UPI000627DE36|nr:membrane protein [Paenibacillus sp. DMB20]KKO55326.1 membrane protein [Paenibacillus sp. DMB20]